MQKRCLYSPFRKFRENLRLTFCSSCFVKSQPEDTGEHLAEDVETHLSQSLRSKHDVSEEVRQLLPS